MDTSGLDVVYFVKDAPVNPELVYSLRSLDKNLTCGKVWIYGCVPDGITPDRSVKIVQVGATKWDRVRSMYRSVCLNEEISDDFILMNDDFFFMQKTESLDPFYRSSLLEHIGKNVATFNKLTGYAAELVKAYHALEDAGIDPRYSFELHVPMVFNRTKLLQTLGAFPDIHATRTLYGNMHRLEPKQMDDVKAFKIDQPFDPNSQFLSTDDSIWPYHGAAQHIMRTFSRPSRFEK